MSGLEALGASLRLEALGASVRLEALGASVRLEALGASVRLGGRAVLDGVDLALAPGRVTAILGPNGAGKSTLLACLAGLLAPAVGEVRLGGRPLTSVPARERGRRIGLLEQTPQIAWAVDVRTLVGLGRIPWQGARGLSTEDDAEVAAAMARTGVDAFAERAVTTLSGGERARVLLARALAGRPEWLLADEPLTGLDPGHQFDACDLLRGVADAGAGVIVTLHDLSLAARFADRIVLLHAGRVVADGAPTDVLTPQRLADVYGVEARVDVQDGALDVRLLGRA